MTKWNKSLILALALAGCQKDDGDRQAVFMPPIPATNQLGNAIISGTNLIQPFVVGRLERLAYKSGTGYVVLATIPIITATNYIQYNLPISRNPTTHTSTNVPIQAEEDHSTNR